MFGFCAVSFLLSFLQVVDVMSVGFMFPSFCFSRLVAYLCQVHVGLFVKVPTGQHLTSRLLSEPRPGGLGALTVDWWLVLRFERNTNSWYSFFNVQVKACWLIGCHVFIYSYIYMCMI